MSTRVPTDAEAPRRPRGRPRKFDHTTALDAALRTFWSRGYGGTSMDELCLAMGMNRPSVYASFGNKDAVYAAAVEHYVRTIGVHFLTPLADPDLDAALTGFFRAVIDTVSGRHGPRGCIVSCTLPAEAEVSEEARVQLGRVLAQVDDALAERLARARTSGTLDAGVDLRALAQILTGGMLTLAIRARGGATRAELARLARGLVTLVTGGTHRRRRAPRSTPRR